MDAAQVTEKILADANAQADEMSKQAREKEASEQCGVTGIWTSLNTER